MRWLLLGCLLACETAASNESEVRAADRKIIGVGAPYVVQAPEQFDRAAAWQIVAHVLEDVPLAEAQVSATLPRFRTWYGKDDVERMFKKLYADLGRDGRKQRKPFTDDAVDEAFRWNTRAMDALPNWTAQRYADYLATLNTREKIDGAAGSARVTYSPLAVRQVLEHYPSILGCKPGEAFATDTQAVEPVHTVRRNEQATFTQLGAFAAAGDVIASGASVYLRRGEPPTPESYDCHGDSCTLDGLVYAATDAVGEVQFDYTAAESLEPSPCAGGEYPLGAALVKSHWVRAELGFQLPVYDTATPRLTWDPNGDRKLNPTAEQIHTIELPNGNRFRLAGLHVMVKEQHHWFWITLWWSDTPDEDLGADRPDNIAGVWRNYKMCAVSSYELDNGASSWCSNPYIEEGVGNAQTNCIGCHQHAGTPLTSERVLVEFPEHGNVRARNNFPDDYVWSLRSADRIADVVKNEVSFYDASE